MSASIIIARGPLGTIHRRPEQAHALRDWQMMRRADALEPDGWAIPEFVCLDSMDDKERSISHCSDWKSHPNCGGSLTFEGSRVVPSLSDDILA